MWTLSSSAAWRGTKHPKGLKTRLSPSPTTLARATATTMTTTAATVAAGMTTMTTTMTTASTAMVATTCGRGEDDGASVPDPALALARAARATAIAIIIATITIAGGAVANPTTRRLVGIVTTPTGTDLRSASTGARTVSPNPPLPAQAATPMPSLLPSRAPNHTVLVPNSPCLSLTTVEMTQLSLFANNTFPTSRIVTCESTRSTRWCSLSGCRAEGSKS